MGSFLIAQPKCQRATPRRAAGVWHPEDPMLSQRPEGCGQRGTDHSFRERCPRPGFDLDFGGDQSPSQRGR